MADISGIAKDIKLGNGHDPLTEMGPMVFSAQQQRIHGYIEQGRSEGPQIATGVDAFGPGFFMTPTVLVEVNQNSSVVSEEIFGTVLVAVPFDDIDEVVRMANDSPYRPGASVWPNNLSEVHRLIPRIESGSVWVNCHTALDPTLPFGGFKQSGLGREMGSACIEHYTELKSVLMNV